ncbi:MAG TPA: hypothetical protein VIJ57_03950 [Hanamia sp.]
MERFNYISFSGLFQEYVSLYLKEYGEKKAKEIADKVNNSNRCNKLLVAANKSRAQLGSDDFVATVLSSISFSFSNAETVCLASLLLLFRWQLETGIPFSITDEAHLNRIFFRIIDKCDKFKTHISSNQNFFIKFYAYLADKNHQS